MSSNSNPPSNLLVEDNSFLPIKPKPHLFDKYANNMLPFFSSLFLLSIFIMIIFILKNFSFPSLFNSTVFWFFISNTLIFIIAVDFALFSLSQHKSFDFYEVSSPPIPTQANNFQIQSPSLVELDEENETPDEKLKIVVREHDVPPLSRTLQRSKSEKPKRSVSKESKKMKARRTESVKYEVNKELEENEFSKMSDEELNKRVEEFIQRFNRQMRLQTRAELKSLVLRD